MFSRRYVFVDYSLTVEVKCGGEDEDNPFITSLQILCKPPHENLLTLFQESKTQLRRTQVVKLTLFELVAATESLSNLGTAVVRAGLKDTLNAPGSLTVFAPNNDAFAKVPADLANTLFTNNAFIPHLKDLLLYHVLGTKIITSFRSPFRGNKSLLALNGQRLAVTPFPTKINGNTVIARNIGASNGVADIIDGVLLPSWVSNRITDRVVAASDLSTLLALVTLAGLGDALADPTKQLTLVAPNNSAFVKLPAATVTFLTSLAGKDALTQILLYHVFPDILVSSELTNGLITPTLEGGSVTVSVTNAGIFLNGKAKVVKANILANNGVVHKINTVLDLKDSKRL
jgi:transforming growth factor-beta-induced protein